MPNAYWVQVVENNWEQFAQNAIILPLLWFHLMQILSMADWNNLNCFGKFFTLIYLALVLIVFEIIRLIFINLIRANKLTFTDSINCLLELLQNLFETLRKANAECSFIDRAVNGWKNVSKNLQSFSEQMNMSNITKKFQNTASSKTMDKDSKFTNHPSNSSKSSSNKETLTEFPSGKKSLSQLKDNLSYSAQKTSQKNLPETKTTSREPSQPMSNLTNRNPALSTEESRSKSKSKSTLMSTAKKDK